MENRDKNFIKLKNILKQVGIVILYYLLATFLQLIFYKSISSKNNLEASLSNIAIELIILTVFIIIFRKVIIPDFDDFKKNGKKYIKNNFKYYISGLMIMMFSNILISSFIGLPSNEENVRSLFFESPIYYVIAAVIAAPIIEELMTRQILKDTFKHKIIYYILSALIFSSLHLLSASSWKEIFFLIPYGALGFVFAIMYNKTNNIWTNIFFHFFHNFVATILVFVTSLIGAIL